MCVIDQKMLEQRVTGWGKNETCDPFDIHPLITLPIHERCPVPPGCMSLSPTGNRTRAFRLKGWYPTD